MTQHGSHDHDFARMSLEEFTKQIPPGWRPGLRNYTYKQCMEKLRLWMSFCDVRQDKAGPLVAARLGGQAFKKAMTLRVKRQEEVGGDQVVYVGASAIELPHFPGIDDGHGNWLVQPDRNGFRHLVAHLDYLYQQHQQDGLIESLDKFFDHFVRAFLFGQLFETT